VSHGPVVARPSRARPRGSLAYPRGRSRDARGRGRRGNDVEVHVAWPRSTSIRRRGARRPRQPAAPPHDPDTGRAGSGVRSMQRRGIAISGPSTIDCPAPWCTTRAAAGRQSARGCCDGSSVDGAPQGVRGTRRVFRARRTMGLSDCKGSSHDRIRPRITQITRMKERLSEAARPDLRVLGQIGSAQTKRILGHGSLGSEESRTAVRRRNGCPIPPIRVIRAISGSLPTGFDHGCHGSHG
jgi:hypothetical protein